MTGELLGPVERGDIIGACTDLVQRFAWLNDQHRYDELANLFTLDGSFARPTVPDAPIAGREAILAFFRTRLPRTQRHLVSNIIVTPVSLDRAEARSVVLLFAALASKGSDVPEATDVLVGEFEDELVRDAGSWRFHRRSGRLILRWPKPANLQHRDGT